MTDTNKRSIIFLLSVATFCFSCAGAPLSPAEMANKRASVAASKWSAESILTVRYNPARCDCPEFEVLLDNVWHRAIIGNGSGTEPIALEIQNLAVKTGPGWTASVKGAVNGIQTKKYRSAVLKLEIKAVCAWPGCNGQ